MYIFHNKNTITYVIIIYTLPDQIQNLQLCYCNK
jgi:hypothetical protein